MSFKVLNKAIIDNIIGKLAIYLVHIISLVIFSRIFTPYEFGIVATIQVFLLFFQLFSDFGLGPALINEKKITNLQRDGIFTFTLYLGLCIGVLFFLFSYFLNYYYSGYSYHVIALISGVSIFFTCLSIVPSTGIAKDLFFMKLAKIELVAHLASLLCTVYFQTIIDPILALASKPATYAFSRFIFLWWFSNTTTLGRSYLGGDITYIKKIIGFSAYQFGFNFINYFSRNLDGILIAKYLGSVTLGIYDRSYQIMRYPVMMTTGIFNSALQPVLSKGVALNIIIDVHNNLSAKLFCISLPVSVFIFTSADQITDFVLGDGWSGVVPLIIAFSISLPVQIIISTSGAFYQSVNKPKLLFVTGCIGAMIFICCIIISIFYLDVEVTAYAITISFILNSFSIYYILFKYAFEHSIYDFLRNLFSVFINLFPSLLLYILVNFYIQDFGFSSFNYLILNSVSLFLCLGLRYRFILNCIRS